MIRAKSATYRPFSAKYVLENLKKAISSHFYKILVDLKVSLAKKECVCMCTRAHVCTHPTTCIRARAYWEREQVIDQEKKVIRILDLKVAGRVLVTDTGEFRRGL